jgi:hypothetical protein
MVSGVRWIYWTSPVKLGNMILDRICTLPLHQTF